MFLSEFADTKHFGLSKENYYDRKKDAEERVKAVIDFVNNDEECRSVQLLRYFNEYTRKTCGRCDVCLSRDVTPVPYGTIEEKLVSMMAEGSRPINEVVSGCSEHREDDVLETIRFLIDNGVLQADEKGTSLGKGNKKSRR